MYAVLMSRGQTRGTDALLVSRSLHPVSAAFLRMFLQDWVG